MSVEDGDETGTLRVWSSDQSDLGGLWIQVGEAAPIDVRRLQSEADYLRAQLAAEKERVDGLRSGAMAWIKRALLAERRADRAEAEAKRHLDTLGDALAAEISRAERAEVEANRLRETTDAEKYRIVDEWKAANGYDDLLAAYSGAVDEAKRMRELLAAMVRAADEPSWDERTVELVDAARAALAAPEPVAKVDDYGPGRCEICGWTLAKDAHDGCVPGNCSYRPPDGSPDMQRIRARRVAKEAPDDVRRMRKAPGAPANADVL